MTEEPNFRYPANSAERPMVWKGGLRAFPIELEIADKFSPFYADAIKNAANSWTESIDYATRDFFTFSSDRPEKDSSDVNFYRHDSNMGVYLLENWPANFSRATLAVTQLSGEIKEIGQSSEYLEIHHADILVNDYYFNSPIQSFNYDMETVILHEMGHFLGLLHDNGHPNDTVMYPTISGSDEKRTPLTRDIRNLKQKYNIGMISPQQSERAQAMRRNEKTPGEPFTLILELRTNGKCAHFLNGELVYEH